MNPCAHRQSTAKFFDAIKLTAAVLMLATVAAGAAQAGTCTVNGTAIPSGVFPPIDTTTPADVTITGGTCTASFDAAGKGIFKYRNVNIYDGGGLTFADNGNPIQFYALSILIENNGSLTAGSAGTPFGSQGGTLTIHLWGPQSGTGISGITCKTGAHCGVPDEIWTSNSFSYNPGSCTRSTQVKMKPQTLPGNVDDCFYPYEKIDSSDPSGAYFSHKVLALSYGGSLQLFGIKGATFDTTITPSNSGKSWRRLNGSLKVKATTLTVDGDVGASKPGGWQIGDHIVVTTTDYLPEHSEELEIVSPAPTFANGATTINFKNADGKTTGVKWPHNGEQYPLGLPGRLHVSKTAAETRAAVALLTRTIRIVSDGDTVGADFTEKPGNYYGGDTIVRQGFASLQMQGVEFFQLGKGGIIMHYPVHFHLARMTPQSKNPNTDGPITYVKDCSVRDSMTRWVTLHGTQGVAVARNVGYKSIGHGFYLEDGTEANNKLYSNIGILARAAIDYKDNPRQVPGILSAPPKDCSQTPSDPGCKAAGLPPPGNPKAAGPDNPSALGFDRLPYFSDSNHPSVFWIMNGWNDFEYNVAAGAGTCGSCYWFVPGQISGPSQLEHWFGYAGEQTPGHDSSSPLEEFVGNSCTSAMNAFTINNDTAACNGVNVVTTNPSNNLTMLASDGANAHYPPLTTPPIPYWPILGGGGRFATRCPDADKGDAFAECGSISKCTNGTQQNCDFTALDDFTTSFNWAAENFAAVWLRPQWALVLNSVISDPQNAGLNFITGGSYTKSDVITGYWGLSRKNVFIGSTQKDNPFASNAGPFNPFTNSDKTATGLTCANPTFGLYCLSKDEGISMQRENFAVNQRLYSIYDGPSYQDSDAFLNIRPTYFTSDGTSAGSALCKPNVLDGNPCANAGFTHGNLPGIRADQKNNKCYLPNAAIAWKQPNGFFYPPAFHSNNLFFGANVNNVDNSVDIRHFVIEPKFGTGQIPCSFIPQIMSVDPAACYDQPKNCTASKLVPIGFCTCNTDADCSVPNQILNQCVNNKCVYGSFTTDLPTTKQDYCFWSRANFLGFTDIDRETVLNDDDGSLTGLTSQVKNPPTLKFETISVNNENFFNAPIETSECASDIAANATMNAKKPPATAKTSPYEYVSTAVYPECALDVPDSKAPLRLCAPPSKWGSACSTTDPSQPDTCSGVLLFRQFLTEQELANNPPPLEQSKRLMGQNLFQRSGLTVNNGSYYIDTTISAAADAKMDGTKSFNEFVGGQKYDLLFVYAKASTRQTYTLFVGKNLTPAEFDPTKKVAYGHSDITGGKFPFTPVTKKGSTVGVWPTGWVRTYDKTHGWLTISFDMGAPEVKDDFDLTKPEANPLGDQLCQPATMCAWNKGSNQCQCNIKDKNNYLYSACHEKVAKCAPNCDVDCTAKPSDPQCIDAICSWSVKDLDCPAAGCEAIEITMPDNYTADDAADHHRPTPTPFASDKNFNWQVSFNNEDTSISGARCHYDASELP